MTPFDLVRLSLENLGRRKGRAFLTAIGVVIGTAAVVVLVGLGLGLQRNAATQVGYMGELTQIQVMPNYGESYYIEAPVVAVGPGAGPPPNQKFITDDTLRELTALTGVIGVYPRDYLQNCCMLYFGKFEGYGSIVGVKPGMLKDLGLEAEGGTLDLEKGAVVIGTQVKNNFYTPNVRPGQTPAPPSDLLGQTIQLTLPKYTIEGEEIRKTLRLRVVGVIAETRAEHDYQMYMSLEEVTNLNQWVMGRRVDRTRDGYPMVMVTVGDVSQVLDVADQITALGYHTYTPQSFVQGINSFFLVLQIVFGGIGGISLLVAAIGIANTMTMAILERTREIGLMKAIGATNRNIMGVFLGEAAGIGLFGGVGGVALGWSAGQVLNIIGMVYLAGQAQQLGYLPSTITVYIPAWLPIFAVIFAALIGTLSGLYPALRAATLVPVLALKYE